jgi:hypothetical protein
VALNSRVRWKKLALLSARCFLIFIFIIVLCFFFILLLVFFLIRDYLAPEILRGEEFFLFLFLFYSFIFFFSFFHSQDMDLKLTCSVLVWSFMRFSVENLLLVESD